jgi:hypothetical protein
VVVRNSGPGDERETDQFAVRVKVTREQAGALLRRAEFDFGDHPQITENPDGTGNLDLFISRAQIEALHAEGYEVDVGHNLSARARSRQNEIGRGDRFEGGRVPPRGLGRKLGGTGRPQRPTDAKSRDRPESPT